MEISEKTRAREAAALRRLFDSKTTKISQEAFGALYQIGNQSMVFQYLDNRRPLNKDAAVKFARGLKVSVKDFSPRLARDIERLHQNVAISDVPPAGDNYTLTAQFPAVPVISWVQAGQMKDIDHIPDPENGEWPIEYPSRKMGPRSWALIVEGDSMDGGERPIPAGHIIFCDPDLAYSPNALVIAKDVDMQRATFKQLISEDGKWYLKALNKGAVFGINGRKQLDDPALRVIAVVKRSRAPDREH